MAYDAVIVGSGVAGLTAALLLAKKGRQVLVLEKDSRPGPVVRGFMRQGIACETGFHFTGMLAPGLPLHRFMCYLGILESLTPLPMPQADACQLFFANGQPKLNLPWGREALAQALADRFPQEIRAINSYLAQVGREVDNTPFFTPGTVSSNNYGRPISSDTLALRLNRLSENHQLHMALALRCALHGVKPEDILFTLHARVDGGFHLSSHSLSGGGAALLNALLKAIEQQGGEVLCGCELKEIITKNRAVQGLRLADGQQFATDICLFTPHPALLPDMLPQGQLRSVYRRRLLSLPETRAPFTVYGAVAENLAPALVNRVFFICPPSSISAAMSADDPGQAMICVSIGAAQNGQCPLAVMTSLPREIFTAGGDNLYARRSNYYLDTKQKITDILLKRVYEAMPGLRGRVKVLEAATPLTFAEYAHNPRGGIYGVYHDGSTGWLSPLTSIKGLLLAGQSVMLPGILGSMASALLAGGFLLGLDNLMGELARCYDAG
jgi:all-trans-retinol 13,14-reductase